jgi:hypothetical protein
VRLKDRLDFGFFKNYLNLDAVRAEIENSPDLEKRLLPQDLETVRRGVWSAMEKWLADDIYDFKIDRIEDEFEYPVGDVKLKGFIDVSGVVCSRNNVLKKYNGRRFILDWKTKEKTLTQDWREKLIDSWQWPLYSAYADAGLAIYRGISWTGNGNLDSDYAREVTIEVPSTNAFEVEEHYGAVSRMRSQLISSGAMVWPRNKPFACRAYGEECPFYSDCYRYEMPRAIPDAKILSYSAGSLFLLCPERSRRVSLQEEAGNFDDGSWSTEMGTAFHRGMAEVYRQVRDSGLRKLVEGNL